MTPSSVAGLGATYGLQLNCPDGYYNDLGTLFFTYPEELVNHLLAVGHGTAGSHASPYTARSIAVFVPCYLTAMALTSGICIPGGLFMPSVVLGGAFGLLYGLLMSIWMPQLGLQPGVFALIAATGTLAGVFRSAVSIIVIVIEGTGGLDFLFGVILAVVVSRGQGGCRRYCAGRYAGMLCAQRSLMLL